LLRQRRWREVREREREVLKSVYGGLAGVKNEEENK
jgi:hypothetical protein